MNSTKSQNRRGLMRTPMIVLTLGAIIAATTWADSKGAEQRLRTSLSGGAISSMVPSGHADFRSEAARNRSRLNVEVENVNLANGAVLSVFVSHAGASVKIGEIQIQAGFGELE